MPRTMSSAVGMPTCSHTTLRQRRQAPARRSSATSASSHTSRPAHAAGLHLACGPRAALDPRRGVVPNPAMPRYRLVLLALALPAMRAAACPELPVLPDAPNAVELQLGATNVNAALGSGGLTAAFSKCGELTVLKWPGPSFYNQLDYLTSNAADARLQPH